MFRHAAGRLGMELSVVGVGDVLLGRMRGHCIRDCVMVGICIDVRLKGREVCNNEPVNMCGIDGIVS